MRLLTIDIQRLLTLLQYNENDPLLFNSGFFLFFYLLFLVMYAATHRFLQLRVYLLSLFSLYFFYKTCGWYVGFIILAAVVDYGISHAIYDCKNKSLKRWLLTASICLNVGLLFYFKYTNFFISILNSTTFTHLTPLKLILPIGISFYTFENLSYTVDVYQGTIPPVKRWIDYLFFLSFFPKLMMGPIVRAADFIPQIYQKTVVTRRQVGEGLYLITAGIIKKVIISDYINANYTMYIFESPVQHTGLECLLAVYTYAIVIYCDFSGYSDMAIGMAKWIGFDININFTSPYTSKSIVEFWRRWHISLSTWLKDYIYIPLGGNRSTTIKTYRNLLLTMIIGGLWHGASWNFVFWGMLHGAALAFERWRNHTYQWKYLIPLPYSTRATQALSCLLTFHFVCLCWIFFRCSTFEESREMISQIIFHFQGQVFKTLVAGYLPVMLLLLTAVGLHLIPTHTENKYKQWLTNTPISWKILYFFLVLTVAIACKQTDTIRPIYLQF